MRLGGETIKPGEIDAGADDGAHLARGIEHGLGEHDDGAPGDAADLVVADGEGARGEHATVVRLVGGVDAALERRRAAEHIAVRPQCKE